MVNMKKIIPLLLSRKTVLLACSATLLFITAFILLWWNRYLGITNDGWHYFHAQQILSGKTPYKDFYLFIPPLHPLRLALELKLFGNYFIVPQIFGVLERLLLFTVLCVWLCRLFPAKYVLIGVVSSAVAYLADTSETLSSLHHEAVFWATLAAFCLSSALYYKRFFLHWSFAAGVFAGLAFLGKQTSGIGITAAIPMFLLLTLRQESRQQVSKALAAYVGGLVLPLGALCLWLGSQGGLSAFVEQIFVRGPKSKGSLTQTLLRPLTMTLEDVYMRRNAVLAVLVVALIGYGLYRNHRVPERRSSHQQILLLTLSAFLALLIGAILSQFRTPPFTTYWMSVAEQLPLYLAEFGIGALFLYYSRRWFRGALTREQWQLWAYVFTTFVVLVTLSLSWAIFVSMLIPALPFLIAFALSYLKSRPWRVAIMTACALMIMMTVWSKLSRPYSWAGASEAAVQYATEHSSLRELEGLNLSPATRNEVEHIVQLIKDNSTAEEAVFVYPHLPIFYVLAHRRPNTFAAVHFFDVCPDDIARQDARTLLAQPPAVIVDLEFSEAQIRDNEDLFRGGQRSGQRELIEAIHQLTANYTLLETYELAPRKNLLRVWAKKK
ncbi:MAG: glycosyltransferase family 39 protein [Acidobacteria bacterium]|nr:glycosyltransferase family 39 protein [Acidobacteriota bacterium]